MHKLRALIVFDEAYGVLPPIATQNPMDRDHRALSVSNAGL